MSRSICLRCQRPIKACICNFFTDVYNDTEVVILQHPQETHQSKGTVPLLVHSLKQCRVILGEDFTDVLEVNQLINDNKRHVVLLYPSENAEQVECLNLPHNTQGSDKKVTLLLLDATWKKAYRMYMLSKNLQQLQHVTLPLSIEGHYDIRSTTKKNALSTLEACAHALAIIESDKNKYQQLLENFVKFNQFQLLFRPKSFQ